MAKKKSRFLRVLLVAAVVAGALALWVGLRVGPEAAVILRSEHDVATAAAEGAAESFTEHPVLGPASRVDVTVQEMQRGVGEVIIEFEQDGSPRQLAHVESPFRSPWKPWDDPPRPRAVFDLSLDRETIPTLREGPAVLRVTATRSGGFLRWPDPVVVERSFTVRLTPPTLAVHSTTHYVTQGGCEAVVYEVGETAKRSGVRAGDWFFPGYPLPGGGPLQRFAFFAAPYDQDTMEDLRLEAEDEVGNRAQSRFVDRFFPKPLGRDTIRLSDGFLEKVVPDILSRTPELRPQGDLLSGYLAINRDLRRANRAELRELGARSEQTFLWRGPFLALAGAKATAGFAERRTYVYQGETVDTQDHLGFDLASVSRASVQAANHGIVLRAGWYGIYGNAVVIDHGYGLLSLYGHLSTLAVAEGDRVERGQEIGRTGATGLAGGDHLHFAMLLHGLPVNPREWWDSHWIHDRLRLKLGGALPEEGEDP